MSLPIQRDVSLRTVGVTLRIGVITVLPCRWLTVGRLFVGRNFGNHGSLVEIGHCRNLRGLIGLLRYRRLR